MDMCWHTQACECECRTSAVLYRHRCSANYATIAELLSSVRFRLVVDDLKPAPPYAPDNTSHAITNRSPSTRAQRISTPAIEATQETARCRSTADQRRQRTCSQAAHSWTPKLLWHESRCEGTREVKLVDLERSIFQPATIWLVISTKQKKEPNFFLKKQSVGGFLQELRTDRSVRNAAARRIALTISQEKALQLQSCHL